MTREQAIEILSAGCASKPPVADSAWTEALCWAERDPALRQWWEERQRFDASVSAALRTIPVPPDLAQRILSERPNQVIGVSVARWRRWVTAAAAMLALGGWLWWWWFPRGPQFPEYRNRMARTALRDYRMDLRTNDLSAIQRYLAQHQAPATYRLSPRLQALPGLGCGILRWQNQPVSMVCFDLGQDRILWLFVAQARAVAGAPAVPQPAFASLGRLATAAWSADDHTYLLMALGTADLLKPFL